PASDSVSHAPPGDAAPQPPRPPPAYLRAHGEDPSQMYEREDEEDSKLALLREGLSGLDERSRDIVKRRWLDDDSKITLQELADEHGGSAERIRQVEANALK